MTFCWSAIRHCSWAGTGSTLHDNFSSTAKKELFSTQDLASVVVMFVLLVHPFCPVMIMMCGVFVEIAKAIKGPKGWLLGE